jgi:hypothetical protein
MNRQDMTGDARRQSAESGRLGEAPAQSLMAACPMGNMCERMLNKRASGIAPLVAGVVLILLGALIFIEPRLLLWLAGTALILVGFMLLMLSRYMRRPGDARGR